MSKSLKAEGKEVRSLDTGQTVFPLPMVKRRMFSKLTQFSEAIHQQIMVIRAEHEAKLYRERLISKKHQDRPCRVELEELFHFQKKPRGCPRNTRKDTPVK